MVFVPFDSLDTNIKMTSSSHEGITTYCRDCKKVSDKASGGRG